MKNSYLPIAHVRDDRVKSEQPLSAHLLAAARLAEKFAGHVNLSSAGYLLGLLHDFGKYSDVFQKYIRSGSGLLEQDSDDFVDPVSNKGRIDHSTAGAQFIWNHYKNNEKCVPYAQMLALCIASHHSGLIDCLSPDGENVFTKRMEKDTSLTHLDECQEKHDTQIQQGLADRLTIDILQEIHRVVGALHKRIYAQFPAEPTLQNCGDVKNSFDFQRGLLTRFLLSCLIDADHTDSANFEDPKQAEYLSQFPKKPWEILCERMEKHLHTMPIKHEIDVVRQDISEHCAKRAGDDQGLFTLTVPTGGGKTLASLRFALQHARKHNLDRIVYIIPYTSIIEQNADVARKILETDEERGNIVLEHHSTILPEKESWQNQLLASNWDAPIVFTTMVQFLEALFASGTSSIRRMHNLANSVLIFDEIQTLPIPCVHLFCQAIDFFVHTAKTTAVLCTATQPRLGSLPRPILGALSLQPEQEIAPDLPRLFQTFKRVSFFNHCAHPKNAEKIAALALMEMQNTGSCLVVCNTKKWAEKIYRLCEAEKDSQRCNVYYLSTNLCPAHRLEQLKAIVQKLDNKKPVICVSTQLIECGVDISFGSVVRFVAGLDSILQSAGRCNRHGENEKGRVHIVAVPSGEENLTSLPEIAEGQRIFKRIIHDYEKLLSNTDNDFTQPELIEAYFDLYFFARHTNMTYQVNTTRADTLISLLGTNVRVGKALPHQMLQQSFATAAQKFKAIDAPTQGLIVPYGEGKELIGELFSCRLFYEKKSLLQKAQRYTVNVYPQFLQQLQQAGAVHVVKDHGIWTLREGFYSDTLGIQIGNQWNMDVSIF